MISGKESFIWVFVQRNVDPNLTPIRSVPGVRNWNECAVLKGKNKL